MKARMRVCLLALGVCLVLLLLGRQRTTFIAAAEARDPAAAGAPAAPTQLPRHTVVVFIQGLLGSLQNGREAPVGDCRPEVFSCIKDALLQSGLGYSADDFLEFSWAEGSVDANGVWQPQPYGCRDVTDNRMMAEIFKLHQMLEDYAHAHQAEFVTNYVLIGHDVGGLLAYLDLEAEIATMRIDASYRLGAVISLDSPLGGVDRESVLAWSAGRLDPACFAGEPLDLLVLLSNLVGERAGGGLYQVDLAGRAQDAGIRIYTLGNTADTLYAHIGAGTQLVAYANEAILDDYGDSGDGHLAVLSSPDAVSLVASFVGPQPLSP